MKKLAMLGAAAALALSIPFSGAVAQMIEGKPKVAFIYFNVKNDGGWVQAQEEARQVINAETSYETAFTEKVEEVASKIRPVVERYIRRGYNVINGSAFGYSDTFKELAAENPNVVFLNAAGTTGGPNLESYYARTYESQYLCGMVAGALTKTDKLGFVAAIPLGLTVWNVNAWALGAQSVNPDVQVNVSFTNAWYDPVKERAAAQALVEQGADVLGQHQDTPATQIVAQENDLFATGYHRDMREYAADATQCSSVWAWPGYLERTFKEIEDGTWKSSQSAFLGIKDGGTDISELGSAVPADVKKMVLAKRDEIIAGKFHPFTGPVMRQDGSIAVAAGETIGDGDLWGMNWLVKGVVGQVPGN